MYNSHNGKNKIPGSCRPPGKKGEASYRAKAGQEGIEKALREGSAVDPRNLGHTGMLKGYGQPGAEAI